MANTGTLNVGQVLLNFGLAPADMDRGQDGGNARD